MGASSRLLADGQLDQAHSWLDSVTDGVSPWVVLGVALLIAVVLLVSIAKKLIVLGLFMALLLAVLVAAWWTTQHTLDQPESTTPTGSLTAQP